MQKSTLYIDESGKSSLLSNEKEPFILTGVILDDQETITIEGFFTYIKRKYHIDETKPFHSYHIFENKNTKLSNKSLLELSNTLAEFISLIPIKITVLEIDKRLFKEAIGLEDPKECKGSKKRKEVPELPYKVLASQLFIWFAQYLKSENRIGQVFSDSRRGGDHQLLKTLNLCKEGHLPQINGDLSVLIKERITALSFAEKNFLSGGLELTDLISYITFFRVRKLLAQNKKKGIDILWNEIKNKNPLQKVSTSEIRNFLGIKKDEVYKDLK
jgi:hypothetical protein